MNEKKLTIVSAAVTGFFGLITLAWWFHLQPPLAFEIRNPGMDNRPAASELTSEAEMVIIGEVYESFNKDFTHAPGEWPQFRGSENDNIVKQSPPLADEWPENGPEILWGIDLGEGHAGAAVKNGRIYIMDYDEEENADVLRCFSLATGEELWKRGYHVKVKRNHGMSRTVPAVTDSFVVTIGPKCHVMCVHAVTGELIWGIDLVKDFGSETPFWYTGQCPIIHDSTVVLAPAGDDILLMGVDLASGEIIWQTPNPNGWKMSHASVVPMTISGTRMFVYSASGGITGVSAEPETTGEILWSSGMWTHSVLVPSPVYIPENRIYLTAGYSAGGMMIEITENNGHYEVKRLEQYSPGQGIASEQQTPLFWQGHLFSILPKDAGALREQMACYHPDDLTTPVWSSGETNRYGLGPYILADGKFYILDDNGNLTMAKASVSGFEILGQAKILDGHDAWAPIAAAGTKMLMRDSGRMVLVELGK